MKILLFLRKQPKMNKLKLTAFVSLLSLVLLNSCEDDSDVLSPDYSRYIPHVNALTGAQQVPANSTPGFGRIEGTYDRKTKTYTYKITWQGLTSALLPASSTNPAANAIHIHGPADAGIVALPAPLGTFPNGMVQIAFGYPITISGSYSGTLYVDGTVVKESELLSGKYYVDIHTLNNPNGEIRGQLQFPAQ